MLNSQKFENTYQGGYLLVVPEELLALWPGRCEAYDHLCEFSEGPIDTLTIGSGFGVLIAGPEGDIVHEASWRSGSDDEVMLAAWNEWGQSDRDVWLTNRLTLGGTKWRRHPDALVVNSGVMVLLHGEDSGAYVTPARGDRVAIGGECVRVAIGTGTYAVDTAEIDERPDGEHCVELVRFVRVEGT